MRMPKPWKAGHVRTMVSHLDQITMPEPISCRADPDAKWVTAGVSNFAATSLAPGSSGTQLAVKAKSWGGAGGGTKGKGK